MRDADGNLISDAILQERYKIINLIQKGPASRMYKAFDTKRNKSVFVKELIATYTDPSLRHQAIEQFKSEAKILFKLKQENLPKFEDYFDYEDNRYLIIEYIEGSRLNNIVESQSAFLEERQVIKWGIELCDSLQYLHNLKPHPVIFRDLSPQSILLSEADSRLKLIDFGISKIYESEAKTMGIAKTMTQHYSPIEQHAGTTDNRSDIYSLGATLYYLICKEPPMDCVERIIDDEPMEQCSKFNPHISKAFEKIIMKAMEVDKKDRYQKIEEMKDELSKVTTSSSPSAIHGVKSDRTPLKPVFNRKKDEEEPPPEEVEDGDSDYKPISFQIESQSDIIRTNPGGPVSDVKRKSLLSAPYQGRDRNQPQASSSSNISGAQSAQTRPFGTRQDQAKPAGNISSSSQAKPAGNISLSSQTKPAGNISLSSQAKPFTRTPSTTEGRVDSKQQIPRRRILEDRSGQMKTPPKSPVLPPLQQVSLTDDTEDRTLQDRHGKRHSQAREEESSKITAKLNIKKAREIEQERIEEDIYNDTEDVEENYGTKKNINDLINPHGKKHFYEEEKSQKKPGIIRRIFNFLFRRT